MHALKHRINLAIISIAFLSILSGSAFAQMPQQKQSTEGRIIEEQTNTHENDGVLFQVATFNIFLQGVYDGDYQYAHLIKQGDFGVGTFNQLDGEMVAVDGHFYRIAINGALQEVQANDLTPFAEVTFFKPQQRFTVNQVATMADLNKLLENRFANKNIPYAIRIDGHFAQINLRSIPAQKKPYPPIAEVVKQQTQFELKNVQGTLVGFWFPQYWAGMGYPGFHAHFVTADRKIGGHILALNLQNGVVAIQPLQQVNLYLPATKSFATANLDNQNISAKVQKIEGVHEKHKG